MTNLGYDPRYSTVDDWWGYIDDERFKDHNPHTALPTPFSIHDTIFGEIFDLGDDSSFSYRCICGHPYNKAAYISHKYIKNLHIAIGNECVKKCLNSKDRNKRCIDCGKLYRSGNKKCKECSLIPVQKNIDSLVGSHSLVSLNGNMSLPKAPNLFQNHHLYPPMTHQPQTNNTLFRNMESSPLRRFQNANNGLFGNNNSLFTSVPLETDFSKLPTINIFEKIKTIMIIK